MVPLRLERDHLPCPAALSFDGYWRTRRILLFNTGNNTKKQEAPTGVSCFSYQSAERLRIIPCAPLGSR